MSATREWVELSPEELLDRAAVAALLHDTAELWSLTREYILLTSRSGGRTSPLTLDLYERAIKRLLADWKDLDLIRPPRESARRWVRHLEAGGLCERSIAAKLSGVRWLYAALSWAGLVFADPFLGVRPAVDRTPQWEKREAYTQEEIAAMRAAVRTGAEETILLLGAHAGLRAHEIADLRWEDVDFSRGLLIVRRGKGGKRRTVMLSEALVAALTRCRAGHGWRSRRMHVDATTPTGIVTRYAIYRCMRELALRAGVRTLGVHSLRHSAGTRLYQETGDIALVAQHLGHASLDTSRVYAHADPRRVRKAVTDW